jgi:hypothetical protein
MAKMTVLVYDAGYKDSSPALLALKNQTMFDDLKIFWVEYYDKIYDGALSCDYVTKIKLNFPKKALYNVGYCYNTGLMLSEGGLFTILDPCLWFPKDCFERIYKCHQENPNSFTYNWEQYGTQMQDRFDLSRQTVDSIEELGTLTGRLKSGNLGCLSTYRRKKLLDINGFDVFKRSDPEYKDNKALVDRGLVSMAVERLITKHNIKKCRVNSTAYHAAHPKYDDVPKGAYNRKPIKAIMSALKTGNVTRARRGVSFVRQKVKLVKIADGLYERKK